MLVRHHRILFLSFVSILLTAQPLAAQLGFQLDIKKPEPYDNRELKAEKTGDKKLKRTKKFFQNTTTHYNYFFNANTKLNEVVDRAKAAHRDDYSQLLPFYNYTLDATAQDSLELDSVIYKSKTGIVLHDLRNDWIDNLYELWGTAYFLQQDFDSAYQMFQFINYAFAEKEKDGYYKYIGSRMDGNNALSIATKENNGLIKRMMSEPPSRNNALLWQVRVMIRQNALTEAGSLIATLKNDPQFPERLRGSLEEVQALWFYQQEMWDSAAHHLTNALDEAQSKQERARWEYLIGQLYERSGAWETAKDYYSRSIGHTTDPVMDIYARLNLIRINKEGGDAYIENNIQELYKMARKDRYAEYRDVIYSMIAEMEIERGNFAGAQTALLKASKYQTGNVTGRNRAYLQLADLSFNRKEYRQAAAYYDSIKIQGIPTAEAEHIDQRKRTLTPVVAALAVIERQDSLQRIANLPEAEREAFVKQMVRQLRKQQGLRDEESGGRQGTAGSPPTTTNPFTTQSTKGDWYFYNNNLKANGAATFKQVWGTRPNMDNWRRQANVTAQVRRADAANTNNNAAAGAEAGLAPTYEALLSRLPLTPAQVQASNDSIQRALFTLGGLYVNEVEDYPSAIEVYEQLRTRFAQPQNLEQILFHLYYSYTKTSQTAKAAEMKRLLEEGFPNGRYATIITTGKDPLSEKPTTEATKSYESVYDLFLEGRFEEAKAAKKYADSVYQTNYWSPQLLYIEAVYHIKNREDSIARSVLNTLIQQNAGTPIAVKAENMISVLSRRQQIEDELSRLQVERPQEDTLYVEPMPVAPKTERKDTVAAIVKETPAVQPQIKQPVGDTLFKTPAPVKSNALFTFNPETPHFAVVLLHKVDVVFGNEARNAFNRYHRDKYYSQPLQINQVPLNDDLKLLIIGNFANAQAAIDYVQKTKAVAASQIVPWLKGDKYSFSIISDANLQTVVEMKDFEAYRKFLDQNLPTKF